ncbi:MAG: hypothetical protein AUJ92_10350 [Armatimonadetes bacterium CG2_30_59_28]|nr:hybrid sensor histidine kinase/response regulator [Armatimonadota bacterium]OIO94294.1 MAG: hypothetical protein AUJ92_10350 [Armatimonadetes bacterium CG2_30_59_28]PIU65471.1 MAG: hypothetical protein COS85_08640 [Armatimonadetes bacterium CG07_land_8_20_14_0_80_59_28]PIX42126.1 MAG: hypothetical protein COZ56_10130 [Armatimonadetes bacterium CG_4_8_14_3_um_filter_58_9]PIY47147.1 MAG: hypothetical protein COZ05_05250 [Armatimonadetes bacterium CG_4_10_14_3_um_filter_59_10]
MAESKGTILVVDDERQNQTLLSTCLSEVGYSVQTAGDGKQALTLLQGQSFDAVLLDLVMPVMDGFQVLERMKEDDALRHIPVIVVSALDEMESVVRCINMGAMDHVPKPFDPVFLNARIGASVEKKKAHDREALLFAQLQEHYRKLQELEKLRDDLTNMIVHDLRTPLTSLLSGLLTMQDMGEMAENQQETLSISIRGGKTLLGMITDLLDISKMEDGSLHLEYKELPPGEILGSAVGQVAHLAQKRNVTLLTDLATELPTFPGDEDKLVRALVNLAGNAIKFTRPGGTVKMSARIAPRDRLDPEASAVLFSVSDTGEGIPSEYIDRIFEKFGQVESRTAGRKLSTGLGLTFCKLAVEAHGGSIRVETKLGEGSDFSFTIPRERTDIAVGGGKSHATDCPIGG